MLALIGAMREYSVWAGKAPVVWEGQVGTQERDEHATRGSWNALPLPAARAAIPVAREYTAAEHARIARGFIPRDMDDRWFIYLEGDTLFLHRSWTGACIFVVRFAPAGAGYRIAEAWANRDPVQYRVTDIHADATDIARLIDLLLLRQSFLTPEWPTM
jgi:hypothetical protein